MPLLKGKENVSRNIREMIKAGHPAKQAEAAAYREAGKDNAPMVTAPNSGVPQGKRRTTDDGGYSIGDMWPGRSS